MATNFVNVGDCIDWTNDSGSAVTSGSVVVIGGTDDAILGIALTDIASTATGAVAIEGVFEVTKASAAVIVAGESVTWDSSASEFDDNQATPASGDVSDAAFAVEDKGSSTTTIKIKLANPGTITA